MILHNNKPIKKGKLKNYCYNKKLNFGYFGLKCLESGFLNYNQIEAARKTLLKETNRKSKIWIKNSLILNLTKKPLNTRMGKGKGSKTNLFFTKVQKGSIILEIAGYNYNIIRIALKKCKYKLPLNTKIF